MTLTEWNDVSKPEVGNVNYDMFWKQVEINFDLKR